MTSSGDARGGRRRNARVRSGMPMSEINITPFVDVMLVLLIIFMVAAPLMTVGIPVELPDTSANALPSDQEEPLTVTLTASGQLLIQNTQTSRTALVTTLAAIAAERTSDQIYFRADGANAWNVVAEIMGDLNAGGFADIGLVTDIVQPGEGE